MREKMKRQTIEEYVREMLSRKGKDDKQREKQKEIR